ncbi:MAG: hypothetical protein COT24_04675 [Candidatus Kerfeldbacteria bacterium CG08_land_8_20_14_0_20_40_16]|uniref:Uncharacterized protein n=1 Tax=Candidatus Kerfeldbacteria bacterium CG08_land_8_20_14_0_20_40_16 TaxID=2014244 RepID=A0A2H0YUN6_9BACT|nr:MAG: hypothetical protein COT24_04675 [Candidatus Kerfeldbacteria bacterium CG08_land_8_20_14_0_20_40_16]
MTEKLAVNGIHPLGCTDKQPKGWAPLNGMYPSNLTKKPKKLTTQTIDIYLGGVKIGILYKIYYEKERHKTNSQGNSGSY